MRKEFAEAVIALAKDDEKIIFLTGDLGYMALEGVKDVLGERFINAGVAEQNMATMAASLAAEGFVPIIYSISPFITLRPYEQIRNDICLHNLPVKIIANGGGYGYGIMGGTHHNIEDIGSMRILPNMKVFVPFTGNDVGSMLGLMMADKSPNYLRLNLPSRQAGIAEYAPWRRIKESRGEPKGIVIATGTVADQLFELPAELLDGLEIWLVSLFPIEPIPSQLMERIEVTRNVITIEEHRGECGLNETIAGKLLKGLRVPIRYNTLFAQGYPSGKYGSQKWHLEENGLAGDSLMKAVHEFIK